MISFFHRKNKIKDVAWLGVDMHNHLLPGIDDGAVDVGQSFHFIKALCEMGFSKFVCTPHIFTELYPNNLETITAALMDVKAVVMQAGLCLKICTAAEYMVDETFKVKDNLLCLPGQHVLIEMSYLAEMPNIEQVIFDLQLMGFKPVIAHPERYAYYHKNAVRYQRLKDMGVLFQLNLLSVSGYYGKGVKMAAVQLLKAKSYDFAGTDLHHLHHLTSLQELVFSGRLFELIGHYPFKNKEFF